FRRVEGFENVNFAGELVGVAVAAVRMEDDRVFGRILTDVSRAVANEIQFAQSFAAAVEPQVAAEATRTFVGVAFGDDEAVRLNGAVNFGNVGANDEARGGRPRRLA